MAFWPQRICHDPQHLSCNLRNRATPIVCLIHLRSISKSVSPALLHETPPRELGGVSSFGATTTGHYPGLGRFGRVRRQVWVDLALGAGSGGNPSYLPVPEGRAKHNIPLPPRRTCSLGDRLVIRTDLGVFAAGRLALG